MQDFRKLDVWTKAHELALSVHRTFGSKRKSDQVRRMLFGLTKAVRGASRSPIDAGGATAVAD